MRVVLGVSGGIAAYKACSLLRLFTENGHDVTVVPTEAALRFVGAPTWSALSGKPVSTDVWSSVHEVPHVRIGQNADLVVVAPATADVLAKAAAGLADDLLTNTLLTARCPVAFAPAMHTEMWEHPATRANVATLRSRGAHVIDPASGRLTGADTGPGRLPEPEDLYAACLAIVSRGHSEGSSEVVDRPPTVERPVGRLDLAGRKVVVSAGGTREPLDPVRFLGNRSSGKQGWAIARAAAARGAEVTLVAANVALPAPDGIRVLPVETTLELMGSVLGEAATSDVVVMAAAPADFRPAQVSDSKIKKASTSRDDGSVDGSGSALTLRLVENPDIVRALVGERAERGDGRRPVVVSFAAETGDATGSVMDHARAKFERKGSDVQVVNEVGVDKTFGRDDTTVHILLRGSDDVTTVGPTTKDVVADALWDAVVPLLT
ncbi:bifunctional phosphopantothenoylcysteine decarboxylase/phosphopantothenate--cysteine ligase CoaBC [Intrasporangium mesophilum]